MHIRNAVGERPVNDESEFSWLALKSSDINARARLLTALLTTGGVAVVPFC